MRVAGVLGEGPVAVEEAAGSGTAGAGGEGNIGGSGTAATGGEGDTGGAAGQASTCSDGVQNGDETRIDCGGSCPPCPNCRDGVQNQDETDVDCGGGGCPACGRGQSCVIDSDCETRLCAGGVCVAPSGCDGPITFTDPDFEFMMRIETGKASGDILFEDVVPIADLSLSSIANLTGIECMHGLTELRLSGDYGAVDLSPLAALPALWSLEMRSCDLTDISQMAALTSLTYLYLPRNNISDVTPLSGLTSLTDLVLWGNSISDLTPLSGLTSLTRLALENNNISDPTPITGLTSLQELRLSMNNIMDLSPLVAGTALGDGDRVELVSNPFDCMDQLANILALTNRGVDVSTGCP